MTTLHKKTRILSPKKTREKTQNRQTSKDVLSKNGINFNSGSKFQVSVRVRPLNTKEISSSVIETLEVRDNTNLYVLDNSELTGNSKTNKGSVYTFTNVFNKNTSQTEVYKKAVKPIINGVLDGYNSTIFAYGPTGAGKTYTMLGGKDQDEAGIIPRALADLFEKIDRNSNKNKSYSIKFVYIEIYNENIRDLIGDIENLKIRQDPNKGTIISGAKETEVKDQASMTKLILKGNDKRTIEQTSQNKLSSRSHAILQISLDINETNANTGLIIPTNTTKFLLVDLAGSERNSVVSSGQRPTESGAINKSLLTLGRCIEGLVARGQNGKTILPWRESKLTQLLQESLEGKSFVVMITNVSPYLFQYEETLNNLRYADKASNIKSNVKKNYVQENEKGLNKYYEEISKYSKEIEDLRRQLAQKTETKHLRKPQDSTSYNFKIEKMHKEISGHFDLEIYQKKEIMKLKKQHEYTRQELALKEYEHYKTQKGTDNIVNKEKGISLKLKELKNEINNISDRLNMSNNLIQDKNNEYNELKKKRDYLDDGIARFSNEPLGSSLNVSFKYYIMQLDKMEFEFYTQVMQNKVKKKEFELIKLTNQIKQRDLAIEAAINDLEKKGVTNVDVSEEKKYLTKVQDFHIEQNMYLPTEEEFKERQYNAKANVNNQEYSYDPNDKNRGRKNEENPHEKNQHVFFDNQIKYTFQPQKKDYNKNNSYHTKYVKELSTKMFNYGDYHNPNVHIEKMKFKTKTTEITDKIKKGQLSALKLNSINNLYPNSKVNYALSSKHNNDNSQDKINLSIISNNNNNSINNSINNSFVERAIDQKAKKLPNAKNILDRFKKSPYIRY